MPRYIWRRFKWLILKHKSINCKNLLPVAILPSLIHPLTERERRLRGGWEGAETWNARNLDSGRCCIPPESPKLPLLLNSHGLSPLCDDICTDPLILVIIFVTCKICDCAQNYFPESGSWIPPTFQLPSRCYFWPIHTQRDICHDICARQYFHWDL